MEQKINIYAKIDQNIKNMASLYITNSKLAGKETNTLAKLVEKSIQEYITNHPL